MPYLRKLLKWRKLKSNHGLQYDVKKFITTYEFLLTNQFLEEKKKKYIKLQPEIDIYLTKTLVKLRQPGKYFFFLFLSREKLKGRNPILEAKPFLYMCTVISNVSDHWLRFVWDSLHWGKNRLFFTIF